MQTPTYTPEVLEALAMLRKLTTGELLAVNHALEGEWTLPDPPPEGVREPRNPKIPNLSGEATADDAA